MSSAAFFQSAAASDAALAQLWSADRLGAGEGRVVATGHAALDAQLPGGGWPVGALIEVLQSDAARHVWQLLLPALAERLRHSSGPVVLVGAPHVPFGPALAAGGLAPHRLLWVRGGAVPRGRRGQHDVGTSAAWACEQALRCAEVAAVLAWLPNVRASDLRRLHSAAQQHDNLLFALRPATVRNDSSPARLRLLVDAVPQTPAPTGTAVQGAPADLQVDIVKRRGPPLAEPLQLAAWPRRLAAVLAAAPQRMAAGSAPTPTPAAAVVAAVAAVAAGWHPVPRLQAMADGAESVARPDADGRDAAAANQGMASALLPLPLLLSVPVISDAQNCGPVVPRSELQSDHDHDHDHEVRDALDRPALA